MLYDRDHLIRPAAVTGNPLPTIHAPPGYTGQRIDSAMSTQESLVPLQPRAVSLPWEPETANALTHGLGCVLSLIGAAVLLSVAMILLVWFAIFSNKMPISISEVRI